MRLFFTALAAAVLCCPPLAQAADTAAPKVANSMKPLAPLIGIWRGEGWAITNGPDRHPFTMLEEVEPRLGGRLFLVRGRGHVPGKPDQLHHDALSFLTFEPQTQKYEFRINTTNFTSTPELKVLSPNSFSWELDIMGMKMAYLIEMTADTWRETGQRSTDGGKTWTPIFEMNLKRSDR